MQNYTVGYPVYPQVKTAYTPVQQQNQTDLVKQNPVGNAQAQAVMPVNSSPTNASGATFNIGVPQGNSGQSVDPNATNINGASGVTINIMGAGVYPNGANINNTYNTTSPVQSYPPNYYINNNGGGQQTPQGPSVPVGATPVNQSQSQTDNKTTAKKDIVLLTDEYIKTLENYIRNDNPDIKLMGAKELMKRFREDDSRKNDPALTALLNLVLQSKYSQVKMVGMGIIENGWAQGDQFTQQLLSQIQQSKSGYGLDALDAASAALKAAGQTVKVDDPNPPKPKTEK